jgi:hypothetical protein
LELVKQLVNKVGILFGSEEEEFVEKEAMVAMAPNARLVVFWLWHCLRTMYVCIRRSPGRRQEG